MRAILIAAKHLSFAKTRLGRAVGEADDPDGKADEGDVADRSPTECSVDRTHAIQYGHDVDCSAN